MRTDFAERVGRTHGLERGIEGSVAQHERVKRVYAHITDPLAAVELPERRRGAVLGLGGETDAEWRNRASEAATDALKGVQARWHRDARENAVEAHVLNQKVTGTPRMQEENDQLRRKLQAYPQLVEDLQGRLDKALKRARQAEATNDRLNTLDPDDRHRELQIRPREGPGRSRDVCPDHAGGQPEGRGDGGTGQAPQTVSQAVTPNPRLGRAGPGTQDSARRRGKPDLGASDQAEGRCLGLRALTLSCALS